MMLEKQLSTGELVSSGPFFMKAPPPLTALVLVERTRIRLRRTTLHWRVGLCWSLMIIVFGAFFRRSLL